MKKWQVVLNVSCVLTTLLSVGWSWLSFKVVQFSDLETRQLQVRLLREVEETELKSLDRTRWLIAEIREWARYRGGLSDLDRHLYYMTLTIPHKDDVPVAQVPGD